MAKAFRTSVVTANDLIEGHAVFLCAEGWAPTIEHALLAFTTDEAESLEALAQRFVDENHVVGPYLVEVEVTGGRPVPLTRRERIRASGLPTVPFGYDAQPMAVAESQAA